MCSQAVGYSLADKKTNLIIISFAIATHLTLISDCCSSDCCRRQEGFNLTLGGNQRQTKEGFKKNTSDLLLHRQIR